VRAVGVSGTGNGDVCPFPMPMEDFRMFESSADVFLSRR
jgi:hypothetical protein